MLWGGEGMGGGRRPRAWGSTEAGRRISTPFGAAPERGPRTSEQEEGGFRATRASALGVVGSVSDVPLPLTHGAPRGVLDHRCDG